jgi:mono/diheme cytochrome c family protein
MAGPWRRAALLTSLIPALGASPVLARGGAQPTGTIQPPLASGAELTRATLATYCVTCHNERLKTAGLVLDSHELAGVGASAERWEKVVRKLRATAMPPSGMPRPDEPTYNAVATWLESELDRAASARPEPGGLPALHRLSRTEYQNAIRDLLAVDALPKEMDYSVLLPADNAASGFDNLADLLFMSPAIMERYFDAARKISRLAVGDPKIPLMVNIYRLPGHLPQDGRVDDLPFGTRGGTAIRSTVPLDGDYAIKIELAGPTNELHQLEVTADGQRLHLLTVGEAQPDGQRGVQAPAAARGGRGGRGGRRELEVRVRLHAGSRLIGVSFIEHTDARDEETVRPRLRSRGPLPAVANVTISGPFDATGPGDTPSRQRIFTCQPVPPAVDAVCAKQILRTLARRAYRRPVNDGDLQDLWPFYESGHQEGGFERGIQAALERLLVSPQFLYRIEQDPPNLAPGTPYRLTDLQLASRLSFFLWSSIPDDMLLSVAVRGQLKNPTVLSTEVHRMMADPRAESLVTNFATQWLYLRDVDGKKPDELLFPDFDEGLRQAFRRETELFLDSVLRSDRSVLDLLDGNYTFVNERLAKHYGIPNIVGSYFRRVDLGDDSQRGGLLGQGSILTLTSYANRTSPVVRGKWVLENLLSAPPPPPPPNVPVLVTEAKDTGRPFSMREAMTVHRSNPACAGCHARMDPIGFSLEHFDAVGAWRDRDAGVSIDATGSFAGGVTFDGLAGLKKELLRRPEQFVGTVAEKLLMYGIGRNVQYFDAPALRAVVHGARPSHYTFESLVMGVVNSVPFQMRKAQGGPHAPAATTARR